MQFTIIYRNYMNTAERSYRLRSKACRNIRGVEEKGRATAKEDAGIMQ